MYHDLKTLHIRPSSLVNVACVPFRSPYFDYDFIARLEYLLDHVQRHYHCITRLQPYTR